MEWMNQASRAVMSAGLKLLFAAAAIIAMAVTPLAPAIAGEDGWRVSDIQGEARVRTGATGWRALKRGQEIRPRSQVETGKSGRLLLVRPGDSIAVSPNSRFDIPKGAARASTRANPTTHIVQMAGTLLFKITTRPEKPFGVKTPYLAAVIKGTTFTVSVNPRNAALHVSKGAVQVNSIKTGESVLVRPGQTAAVGPASGGRLRMFGVRRSKRSHSRTVKGKKIAATVKTDGKQLVARKSAKPGLRIGKTIGAGRVNIARASNGLLVRAAPANHRGRTTAPADNRGRTDTAPNHRGPTAAPATRTVSTTAPAPAAPRTVPAIAAAPTAPRAVPTTAPAPVTPRGSGPPTLGVGNRGPGGGVVNLAIPPVAAHPAQPSLHSPPTLGVGNRGPGGDNRGPGGGNRGPGG